MAWTNLPTEAECYRACRGANSQARGFDAGSLKRPLNTTLIADLFEGHTELNGCLLNEASREWA